MKFVVRDSIKSSMRTMLNGR